ncbi:diacylglycerol kinase [Saccharospirillum salsuginis]|uniref:Diacylglycerol kinase n=1 Tax=Saccharospirillum salsuginis TaxID=418750 RepID=A0A918NFU0_9GAMM|nr:diacylglycerol kinase [Saccharospirillum salsuginis]GGX64350.1 diacylglycerol kinase [Saccharospirillum salsuginis]
MTELRKQQATGLRRLINASRYSAQGLRSAFRHEAAFRQESWVLVVGVPCAFWVGTDLWQTALLIASLMLIMVVEMINSALESLVDRVGTDFHELSGRTKDMGSAAVLLSILVAVVLWGAALWQRFA